MVASNLLLARWLSGSAAWRRWLSFWRRYDTMRPEVAPVDVSIEEAAAVLKTSASTIRRRIRSGVLLAYTAPDGRVLVSLTDEDGATRHHAAPEEGTGEEPDVRPLQERIAGLEALLAEVQTTNADLRRQVEAHERAESELRQLLLQAQLTVQALTPKLPAPEDLSTQSVDKERRQWWRWW